MNHLYVIFDGQCNLCNASVRFIIKRDGKGIFKFIPSQQITASTVMAEYLPLIAESETIRLIDKKQVFTKSTAALRISRKLDGLWPVCYGLIIIPKFIRDWFYQIVARYRYSIFGRREKCMLPSKNIRDRFL